MLYFGTRNAPGLCVRTDCGVFDLGFFQDGDIAIGIFPEGKEILTGVAGLGESPFILSSSHLYVRQLT